jgi:DNA-binding response OmpR family regulator
MLSAGPPGGPTRKGRLLILDDDEEILLLLGRYLRGLGYEVVTCDDARQAEELTEREAFDIVLLDVALSPYGREGLDVLRAIRLHDPLLPVVVFSGSLSRGIEDEARWLRATAVVHKPQPLASLARLVETLLDGRG